MIGMYIWSSSCLTGRDWGRQPNVFYSFQPLVLVWTQTIARVDFLLTDTKEARNVLHFILGVLHEPQVE